MQLGVQDHFVFLATVPAAASQGGLEGASAAVTGTRGSRTSHARGSYVLHISTRPGINDTLHLTSEKIEFGVICQAFGGDLACML